MNEISTPFSEAFPNLLVSDKIRKYLDYVVVDRVVVNQARNRLRVYITSDNWIRKSYITKLEEAIAGQVFTDVSMQVKIVEHFHLSGSYTPENFYEVYRDSMLTELKDVSPLLHQAFLHTELTFSDPNLVRVEIPESIVAEEKKVRIHEYLEKVFCERAGFSGLEIEQTLVKEENSDIFDDVDQKIEAKISNIIRQNAERKTEPKEEKKLPSGEEQKQYRRKQMLNAKDPTVIYGKNFDDEAEKMETLGDDPRAVTVRGEVFATEARETRSGRIIFTVSVTDYTDSLRLKLWFDKTEQKEYEDAFKKGNCFLVKGMMDFDPYDGELMVKSIFGIKKIPAFKVTREDTAPEKRVELHCHTKMSDMDAVSSATSIISQAYHFGMHALAITDHGVVQSFPEAYKTFGGKRGIPKDADFKVIYGMEGYLVDDMKNLVSGPLKGSVTDTVVIFSTVTTGQSPYVHDIIELAAQKVTDGKLTEEFTTLINPGRPIPFAIQTEIGITDEMVAGSPDAGEAVEQFLRFVGDLPLVAYEADQEMNFILAACSKYGLKPPRQTLVDIPGIVRYLVPDLGRIRFKTLVKHMKVNCRDEMRANPRAESMALVWIRLLDEMEAQSITTFSDLNDKGKVSTERARNLKYHHIIMLASSVTGKYNLYTLVSESNLRYFKRRPLIPRSVLNEHREGLVLGSACSAGELYSAILNGRSDAEIARIVEYYDYLEVQPTGNNNYLLTDPRSGIKTEEDLRNINRKIVSLGDQFHKPVCATCDVHFLNPDDAIYRSIIQAGHGYKDAAGQPPLFLRTTDEMLEEFSYLGEEKAKEIVITNTNMIADRIEKISPIHPDKCPPSIPHSEEDLQNMCYAKARRWYGDPIPEIVKERLDRELNSIIENGYAVMYIIAQKLVKKSNDDGYLVGSRGSVGSSFVATMADITEVNPLAPHYRCLNPDCLYSDFTSEEPASAHLDGRCGCDMPDAVCPKCGQPLFKDGFDIPFETFLGFAGNKEPDIDLNFSGDEQNVAQQYTEVIFGKGQTFKAGTIGTVADKTAYGYAMHYFEDKGITKRRCELERLSEGCVGVRRTTGQHPGGVVVLPKGMDINWFTPVQRPANDVNSPFITTHFDYHSIDSNLLKLDILGHDDPTIIRMLQDLTETDPHDVPLDDKDVLSLFSGTDILGIRPSDIDGVELGTLGVPEFGTTFVMGMLKQTHPKTFSELIRISGLSHGTDVWLNNAQYYIEKGFCTLPTSICCRDDIMLYLINKGMDKEHSFKIMESVRKGKGLTAEQEKEMREHGVEDWYIESCLKIKYMFPKAHAAAYVMNAFRIAYYKIHYPLAYYAAYFSIRLKTFNYETMCLGRERLEYFADSIKKNPNPTPKEEATLDDMRLVREMYARGYTFQKLDLYKAGATRCRIIDGKIMPALNSVGGLGDSQAVAIEKEAAKGPFLSKDDFRERCHVSGTIIDLLDELGVLGTIPESNQISLFDLV
jgi:DNA polymerase-3 subunit alpha (Gram-positive type)